MNPAKRKNDDGKLALGIVITLAIGFAVLLPLLSGVPHSQVQGPNALPGQTSVLLSDGRWLLVGGENAGGGGMNAISFWNPQTGNTSETSAKLQHGRAWHTATMLPDGTVLILGGVGANRQVVEVPEVFDPQTQRLSTLTITGLTGRARHSATLLTDGTVLIAGGVDGQARTLDTTELWNFFESNPAVKGESLTTSRRGHTASLMADGNVVLQGGTDGKGSIVQEGDQFDLALRRFMSVDRAALATLRPKEAALFVASIPTHRDVNVPTDAVVALRFSKPLRVQSINTETISLSGPKGAERVRVIPAEKGMLAYVSPEVDLLPGSTYNVTVNGVIDQDGLLVPVSGIIFSTTPLQSGATIATKTSDRGLKVIGESVAQRDDEDREWRGGRKEGRPHSDWQDLPPLQAPAKVTALAGQVLDLRGDPLAHVTLQVRGHYGAAISTRTDGTGRFLIQKLHGGWSEVTIDGREARARTNPRLERLGSAEDHGLFKFGLEILADQTNVLPFTIWLPKIDTKYAVRIASPTITEVVVTNPNMPGLELRLPAGAVVYDHDYKVVREVGLTEIPLDRTPFPLPRNVIPPVYFTAQPGGGYVHSPGGVGARVIYPNNTPEPPGARFSFWHYDTEPRSWYVYGLGKVSEDGKQIVPDPGVSIYRLLGAMANGGTRPDKGPNPCPAGKKCDDGDPVDMGTGLFVLKHTDLFLPDILPLSLTRTYRPEDPNNRPFGIGATHPYAMFFSSTSQTWAEIDLILPHGGQISYNCIAGANCNHWTTAQLEHTSSQTEFYKSKIVWNGDGWDLTLKNGTVYVLGENAPLQAIRDRNGNQITITRTGGQSGNITRITSPNNRWIEFTYGSGNRVSQAKDNLGRTVTYTYDASGRLWKVTDPNSGVTEYTYDASHRMLTIKDARGIVFLTNEYNVTTGRVTRQTLADAGVYQFSYTTDGNGKTVQTDVTDPRNYVRRVAFNADGQITSDTDALGTAEAQVTTYNLQTGTNLALSITDPLNRTTAYSYDSIGNTTSVSRLSGTPDAVTTTFTYEPIFNQLKTATDPLSHTTTFGYDTLGNLISISNPLNQTTNIVRNASGQPVSVTDPLNNTTQFSYDFGDLVAATDPLGNITNRFVDSAGRVLNVTNALGNPTFYDYDVLNRLTKVTDPINGQTSFGYDPNGNLLNVTDARSSQTVYTYENMDRLATRKDPLLRMESYQYDLKGNMTRFTDRKSQATNYTYDGINRRTGVTYADSSATAYTYDKGNRLTQVVDSIAGTIARTYDGLNRTMSETTPQGSVGYTYDAAGRRTSMTVFGQASVNYTYDNANRLTQITQGSSTVTYTYDAAGRRTSLTLPNNVLVEYAYDNASRLTGITYKQNGTTLLGNLTYEYDKNGNRTKTGGSFARTGLPQAVASTAYNAANHQTTFDNKTLTYDNNGNLQTITDPSGTTTYTWNARNQLTGISGPGVSATFVYDGLGRREKKTINSNLTEFLYDRLNPVQETSGATILANILPGLGVDEFLTRTDVVAGVTSSFLTDALGSPVAVNDNSGAVQTEYTYEPFGRTSVSGASNSNPYQYTGRDNDGPGLFYYRARYYHPRFQRFISEDPLNVASVQVNANDEARSFIAHTFLANNITDHNGLYLYVTNNPINLSDPSGLIGLGGSAGLGAGLGATGAIGTRKPLLAAAVGAALGLAHSPFIGLVPGGAIGAIAGFVGGVGTGLAAAAVGLPNDTGAALSAGLFGGIGGLIGGAIGGGWGATLGTGTGITLGLGIGNVFSNTSMLW